MYVLAKSFAYPLRSTEVAQFATFEEAKNYVRKAFSIIMMEDDADNEGCADIFTATGDIYTIEPNRSNRHG